MEIIDYFNKNLHTYKVLYKNQFNFKFPDFFTKELNGLEPKLNLEKNLKTSINNEQFEIQKIRKFTKN